MTKSPEELAREWAHQQLIEQKAALPYGCVEIGLCGGKHPMACQSRYDGYLAGHAARDKELEEFPHDHFDHCCLSGETAEEDEPEFKETMACKCRKAGHAAALAGLPDECLNNVVEFTAALCYPKLNGHHPLCPKSWRKP